MLNFVTEDEHVLLLLMSPEIRSYSDAINSYELFRHTFTRFELVSCYDQYSLLMFAFFVSVNLVRVTDLAYSL